MRAFYMAAPQKSSGKTTLTVAIAALLRQRGQRVQLFKKGPDYIDPMWHRIASGQPSINLDFQTMSHPELEATFNHYSQSADVVLVEGNMGIFDSLDRDGRQSNAELAKLLKLPVILVVDAKGATRSWMAMVQGLIAFDPELTSAGVIFNRVAGRRHAERLREVAEDYLPIPLLGTVERSGALVIDERQLGLIPSNEAAEAEVQVARLAATIAPQIDLDRLLAVVPETTPVPPPFPLYKSRFNDAPPLKIGIARDEAFGFYYPSDLDYFRACGVELIPFSPLHDTELPAGVAALWIGGGFPENFIVPLAANRAMKQAITAFIEADYPVYAECGGLMYLCQRLTAGANSGEMVGVVAAEARLTDRPVGRGYATLEITADHPWRLSRQLKGAVAAHEFHYSTLQLQTEAWSAAYRIGRGQGIDGHFDGWVYRRLLANYIHLRHTEQMPWIDHFLDFIHQSRLPQL